MRGPHTELSRYLRAVLALTALLGTVGCVTPARNPFVPAGASEAQIVLFLENRGFNDIRVYAVSARGNQSLGEVGGNTQRRVSLDWRQFDQISFRIEVLAGRSYSTLAVPVSPGDQVHLLVPSDPSRSSIQVR